MISTTKSHVPGISFRQYLMPCDHLESRRTTAQHTFLLITKGLERIFKRPVQSKTTKKLLDTTSKRLSFQPLLSCAGQTTWDTNWKNNSEEEAKFSVFDFLKQTTPRRVNRVLIIVLSSSITFLSLIRPGTYRSIIWDLIFDLWVISSDIEQCTKS